jgi:hypothetical protein
MAHSSLQDLLAVQCTSCVATTRLRAGMRTIYTPILRDHLMVRPHRSKAGATPRVMMPHSRPRLFRPPWVALFHIEIPQHAVPDDVFNECIALTPWLHVVDYLLYSRFYVPTGRLDALYSTRLSSTLQALITAFSDPRADVRQSKSTRTASSSRNIMHSPAARHESPVHGVHLQHGGQRGWRPNVRCLSLSLSSPLT